MCTSCGTYTPFRRYVYARTAHLHPLCVYVTRYVNGTYTRRKTSRHPASQKLPVCDQFKRLEILLFVEMHHYESKQIKLPLKRGCTVARQQVPDGFSNQFPGDSGVEFRKELDCSSRGNPPRTLRGRQKKLFGQVFRQIPCYEANFDLLNEDDAPATEAIPRPANPLLRDIAIKQNMQMRNPALSKLRDTDVIGWRSIFPPQVLSELVEGPPQVFHGILTLLELGRVEGECQEVAEALLFSDFADSAAGCFCLPGSAVATRPGAAVDSPINRAIRLWVFPLDAQPATILAPPFRAGVAVRWVGVSIIRYRVK